MEKPQINVTVGPPTWCKKHFRADLPMAVLTVRLFEEVLKREDFAKECGQDPANGKQADASAINTNLTKHNPLCCYVGEEVVQKLYLEAMMPRGTS